jgi:hypothetical protein
MPTDDDDYLENERRRIRIGELMRRAGELSDGQMVTHESEDMPLEIAEQFWEQVVAYEEAPWTTHFKQLEEAGVELPPPEALDDRRLMAKLWEVLDRLAAIRVFVTSTNHLSDRALYTHLWNDSLREETPAMQFGEGGAWTIDLVSSGSDEDTNLYLKHYADQEWRQQWLKDFPDYEMPPHEDPPYDRDRNLPQATYGPAPDLEFDQPV